MSDDNECGCCEGTEAVTPEPVYNRPGLDALAYRIGTHGTFLETMKARLSSSDFPALTGLTARAGDDPSIALLDAWATVADVLTFYQERLANEGFLRTATERRSALELARLIGYTPRPGVAATTYLAYTIDANMNGPAEIPAGSKAQSVPGPGELPQTFESSEKLIARKEWNAITPRLTRPQTLLTIAEGTDDVPGPRIYLKGITTNLKQNDALVLELNGVQTVALRVADVSADSSADRTLVTLAPWQGSGISTVSGPTLLRRALKRYQQIDIASIPADSLVSQALGAGLAFLSWLYEQSQAQPPDTDVATFMQRPELVARLIEPFDRLLELPSLTIVNTRSQQRWVMGVASDINQVLDLLKERMDLPPDGALSGKLSDTANTLNELAKTGGPAISGDAQLVALMRGIVRQLAVPASVPPRSSQSLARNPATLYEAFSDVGAQALAAFQPESATALARATANARVTPDSGIRVYALRQKAALYGSSAPRKVTSVNPDTGVATTDEWSDGDVIANEETSAVYLDSSYEKLKPSSWVIIDFSAVNPAVLGQIRPASDSALVARAGNVNARIGRAEYAISGQTTRVALLEADGRTAQNWFFKPETTPGATHDAAANSPPGFQLVRRVTVYFESEELPLAEEPIEEDVCGGDQWIETAGLLSGLQSGRWLIVAGERADIPGTEGVSAAELVMLDGVKQYLEEVSSALPGENGTRGLRMADGSNTSTGGDGDAPEPIFLPGDTLHTWIKLARPLSYCYKRGRVTIYGNVVKATHGDTRSETMGSGDASQRLQHFVLRQPPLTYVPSPTPEGIASTLKVYVNDVQWDAAGALVMLGAKDRAYMTRTDDDGKTTVVFGNGVRGARVPTGVENVKAIYRSGIGKGGNVQAKQISQLLSRPLGVKDVINPLRASGGADRETRDQIKRNAPLAARALDRLVGTRDYADFARAFAGIGKAAAERLVDGGRETVFVTIAGAEDIPIDKTSDLYNNLVAALRQYGDPYLPLRVELRELLMLVLVANVRIDSRYLWDDVVDQARARLLDTFSFERRDLGKGVWLSEVITAIQSVDGVTYVDVDALGAVSQTRDDGQLRAPQEIALALNDVITACAQASGPPNYVWARGMDRGSQPPRPAQIACFAPGVPETLVLNRIDETQGVK
jgi:hypothetical protein